MCRTLALELMDVNRLGFNYVCCGTPHYSSERKSHSLGVQFDVPSDQSLRTLSISERTDPTSLNRLPHPLNVSNV